MELRAKKTKKSDEGRLPGDQNDLNFPWETGASHQNVVERFEHGCLEEEKNGTVLGLVLDLRRKELKTTGGGNKPHKQKIVCPLCRGGTTV